MEPDGVSINGFKAFSVAVNPFCAHVVWQNVMMNTIIIGLTVSNFPQRDGNLFFKQCRIGKNELRKMEKCGAVGRRVICFVSKGQKWVPRPLDCMSWINSHDGSNQV